MSIDSGQLIIEDRKPHVKNDFVPQKPVEPLWLLGSPDEMK
jgi:hypothetical protein